METADVREVHPTGLLPQPLLENRIRAMTLPYAARGIVRAVRVDAERQEAAEAKTRAATPNAYRLSDLPDAVVNGRYRRGKRVMATLDLLQYFRETREIRVSKEDFADEPGVYEKAVPVPTEQTAEQSEKTVLPVLAGIPGIIRTLPKSLTEKVLTAFPTWFNFKKADTRANRHRFPLSAFAAVAAVAVSLMLIVASAVMVTRTESNISRLNAQTAAVSEEISELRSSLEVRNDLLQIRQIATAEYGMVSEQYLKMDYISLCSSDGIEAFEEDRQRTVGISALMSAIGVKK